MGMLFTDASIAFVKEISSNLENSKKENKEIEEKLNYYTDKLNQCDIVVKNTSEEFRKSMYVQVDPDNEMKPIVFDEAFKTFSNLVTECTEVLELGKLEEKVLGELYDELTEVYFPGILNEITD